MRKYCAADPRGLCVRAHKQGKAVGMAEGAKERIKKAVEEAGEAVNSFTSKQIINCLNKI